MSELVVFKANELAISRYDLTEHETKLILCCVALLNPTIENPTIAERTITFTYQQYAQMMGLTHDNAYQRLKSSTRELMTRTVEIIYPTGAISERIFQWVNYAEFNRETQSIRIVFSEYILPYLFQLKRFIKYNLEHVKAFENKYSMRVYEWLLKELTQRKTHKANIEISIDEFKFMMMLENHKSYDLYKEYEEIAEEDLIPEKIKEILNDEKSKVKKNTFKNTLFASGGFLSIYRIMGYVILIFGFFALNNNNIFTPFAFIIGLGIVPIGVLFSKLLKD